VSSPSRYWCELALVGGAIEPSVAITVADGRFASVEPDQAPPGGATRLPGVTIPGLANAHSHAFHRALRSRTQAPSGSFWSWRRSMYAVADRLDPDRYHRLARATFAEMTLAGTTAVGEFHYVHHQPDGTPYDNPNAMGEAVLAAADDAGLRITLLDALYLHGGLGASGYCPAEGSQRRFCDGDSAAWAARVDALRPSATHRIGAAIHSVRAVDPDSMRVAADWANGTGAPLHAHVSEQRDENEQCLAHHATTPTGLLHEAGALGGHFTAIHATHADPDDLGLLAATGSWVCVCPTTERDLGDGIGPTAELVDAGVGLALGTDSHAVIDLLEEARAVELDERLRTERRGVHPAAALLTMATTNGQASLGWHDAGAIAPGRRGDLVTIALDSVRTAGATPDVALEAIVFAASAADVTDVVVGGEPAVRDGQHLRIDVATELRASIADLVEP
jgi:formiminoglutamate deiminase